MVPSSLLFLFVFVVVGIDEEEAGGGGGDSGGDGEAGPGICVRIVFSGGVFESGDVGDALGVSGGGVGVSGVISGG